MNNPIYTTNIKPIENLRNKNGGYSEKNAFLVALAEKCIDIKSIGCNFVIGVEYGKNGICVIGGDKKSDYHNASKILKVPELANFLENLSVTMKDRCFLLSHNDKNQLMVTCLCKDKFRTDWYVLDKNANTEKSIEVENVFSGDKTMITESVSKGKRPLNENDINAITTAFNGMLKVGYNKEIVKKVEKTA